MTYAKKTAEPYHALYGRGYSVPRLRPSLMVGVFTASFLTAAALHVTAILVMYNLTLNALNRTENEKLISAASAAAGALAVPINNRRDISELDSMLRRVMETYQLEFVVVVDENGKTLSHPQSEKRGLDLSPFDVSHKTIRETAATGSPKIQATELLGDKYRTAYYPVMSGTSVWGVLCLSAFDRTQEGLNAITGAMGAGIGVALLTALAFAIAVVALIQIAERSKNKLLIMERLSTTGSLAAAMAHDIKNPLSIILSSTQLMVDDENLSGEQKKLLRNIEQEIKRSSDHIDAFLDLARDTPVKFKNEEMRAFVSDTVEIFSMGQRSCQTTIRKHLPDKPVFAEIDRAKLRRALTNLIVNALDALVGVENPEIDVSLTYIENQDITIAVQDNGPGVSGKNMLFIREPFYTTKSGGSGLGLAIVEQITKQHGGDLTIESSQGHGFTAAIRIPSARKKL